MLTSAIEKVVNLISPYECMICGKQDHLVCEKCWQENVDTRVTTCFWCNSLSSGGRTCQKCRVKTSLSGAIVPYRFNGLVKECIYELKYYSNREMAKLLANYVAQSVDVTQFDRISFVPAIGKHQRKRGYNQAQLLAKAISSKCSIPLVTTLARIEHVDQIGLNRSQRLDTIKNNFIPIGSYSDKSILLVDDVVTTGATLNECAKTLKEAGARRVWAVTVAKK